MSKIVFLFPFSTSLIFLCLSEGDLRIQSSVFLKMRLRKEEKHNLCQVAQVHSFSFLFKLLNSCRLLEISFVHLWKWLRICINAQRAFINLTKKGKNNFNEESAGFLLSNFSILLKACYERESNQRSIKYIVHTFPGKLISQIFVRSVASLDSGMNDRETKPFFLNLRGSTILERSNEH